MTDKQTEALKLAQQFGVRMCDENGDTHGEELYCLGLDDIIALREALASGANEQPAQQESPSTRRWNIERDGDALLVCDGLHDKHEPCEYKRYVPEPAQQERDALLQELARLHDRIKDLERDVEFLSQPAQQQEPVFWYKLYPNGMYNGPIHNAQIGDVLKGSEEWIPLYTSPPASKPLTDEQIDRMTQGNNYPGTVQGVKRFARAIEAAHGIHAAPQLKEKNND